MITFIAALKETGKAISIDSDNVVEIKLISPGSEIAEVIKLSTLFKKALKVTVEEANDE